MVYISLMVTKPLDWEVFGDRVKELLEFASKSTSARVNAERWEEIIFYVLKGMGKKYKGEYPKWEMGSHSPGADIWIDDLAISAKAGSVKNDILTLSSYRLTRFVTLRDMKNFIDEDEKRFDVYLCCAQSDDVKGNRIYQVFVVPSNIFQADDAEWTESNSSWHGTGLNGVVVDIHKKMSNQLWIKIPLKLCTLIKEVSIPKKSLGTALGKVAAKSKTTLE